jgi:hypothetical protein
MSVANDLVDQSLETQGNPLTQARAILKTVGWMSPLSKLPHMASSAFGRNIESSLTAMLKKNEVLCLQLHQKDAAVVISVDHYNEIILLKTQYEKLVNHIQEKQLMDAGREYDQLYAQLTSAKSQEAADGLFAASADDLCRTYKPGKTEAP